MEFYEAVQARYSCRSYRPDPIPDDVLGRMLAGVRRAPSARNVQPWRFVLVTDAELRPKLAQACCGQTFVGEAPLVVVACGTGTPCKTGGQASTQLLDIGIALEHLALSAAAEGLGTCWIGAFDPAAVGELLGIPADVQVAAVMPVGYPADQRPAEDRRKPLADIICQDRYGAA